MIGEISIDNNNGSKNNVNSISIDNDINNGNNNNNYIHNANSCKTQRWDWTIDAQPEHRIGFNAEL